MHVKIEIECIDRNGEPFYQVWRAGKNEPVFLLGVTDCDSAFDYARAEMLDRIKKGGN